MKTSFEKNKDTSVSCAIDDKGFQAKIISCAVYVTLKISYQFKQCIIYVKPSNKNQMLDTLCDF